MARRADGSRRVQVDAWSGSADWHHSQAAQPARKAYHYSHVLTPDLAGRVSPESLAALRGWERYGNRQVPIAWVGADRVHWITAAEQYRRARIVRLVTSRTRGLRTTQRALATRLGVSLGQVASTIRNLERAGVLEVVTVKGRGGLTKLRRGLHLLLPTSRNLSVLGVNITDAVLGLVPVWRHHSELADGETYVPKPYDPPPPRPPEEPQAELPPRPDPDGWWARLQARVDAYRAEVNREVCW